MQRKEGENGPGIPYPLDVRKWLHISPSGGRRSGDLGPWWQVDLGSLQQKIRPATLKSN